MYSGAALWAARCVAAWPSNGLSRCHRGCRTRTARGHHTGPYTGTGLAAVSASTASLARRTVRARVMCVCTSLLWITHSTGPGSRSSALSRLSRFPSSTPPPVPPFLFLKFFSGTNADTCRSRPVTTGGSGPSVRVMNIEGRSSLGIVPLTFRAPARRCIARTPPPHRLRDIRTIYLKTLHPCRG